MNHKTPSEALLQRLLNGEADEAALSELAASASEDPALAQRVGEELGFAELIRQVLTGGEERCQVRFHADRESAGQSMEDLMARVREGRASRFECDTVVKHFWDHPSEVSAFRIGLAEDEFLRQALIESKSEEAFLESLETRMWAETRRDHFVEDFTQRLDREISAREEEPDNIISFPGSMFGTVLKMAAVAAVIFLGAFLGGQWLTGRISERPSVASVVKASADAMWSGSAPDREGKIKSGRYQLERGVVSLKFPGGNEVTVQGPAVFDVNENQSTFVHEGLALARFEAKDLGISLQSKGLSISDPARIIGIDARSDSATEAVVFNGDGGVCLTEGGKCRELFELEAVKADHVGDRLVDIPYNPHAFAKAWELLSGVEMNMGSVRIELPGSEIAPPESGAGEVQVFVENEAFLPEETLEVDDIRTGEFASVDSNPGQSLQAGGQLRSYLLQLWPGDTGSGGEVEASVTFDHPVVGVIFSSDRLTNSDQSVGTSISHVGEDFNRDRGLESSGDILILSDDRRTLNLKLRGDAATADQVRVLVALN